MLVRGSDLPTDSVWGITISPRYLHLLLAKVVCGSSFCARHSLRTKLLVKLHAASNPSSWWSLRSGSQPLPLAHCRSLPKLQRCPTAHLLDKVLILFPSVNYLPCDIRQKISSFGRTGNRSRHHAFQHRWDQYGFSSFHYLSLRLTDLQMRRPSMPTTTIKMALVTGTIRT